MGVLGRIFFGIVVLCAGFVFAHAGQFEWEEIARGKREITRVCSVPGQSSLLYLGCAQGVFGSKDAGQSWRLLLSVGGSNRKVNQLVSDSRGHLYAATGSGLFVSGDQGKSWRKIYKGKNYQESDCADVACTPYGIYLGTRGGLFVSNDAGVSWQKQIAIGSHEVVSVITDQARPQNIYVACADAVFKSFDAGRSWKKIFTALTGDNNVVEQEPDQENGQSVLSAGIRSLCVSQDKQGVLYLATSRGVYRSFDQGAGWEQLPGQGLHEQKVRAVAVSQKHGVMAMTDDSLYVVAAQWQELSAGLSGGHLQSMSFDESGCLYVAGSSGAWRARFKQSPASYASQAATLNEYLEGEPSIRHVQEAAISYADVQPEKILAWKKSASRKAWLPQVSAGVDQSSTDFWHWETGSSTKTGDDVLQRGRASLDWDIRLTWDLGEIIWNNDQTSIDSRSKLMVELRDEIVDEVTKLYFERIRVKIEQDALKIEDAGKRLEKELKLKELAASLDALTGGYFSRALPERT